MPYKNFSKIDKVIYKIAKEKKIIGAVNKYKAIKYWEKAAGNFLENAEGLTKAVDFKNGVLTVACLSKEIAYQIKLLAQRIIESLNKIIGKKIVFAILVEA